jgi:beta-lactam-binding protein with PASTA domain
MKNSLSGNSWFKTILLAVLVLAVYLFLSVVFTGWYTRHGQSIKVPKVSGMPIENAIELLDDNDLELVIIDSVFNEDMKPNTVVEQDPQPDLSVKPGRKIYVTVNTGIVPKVKMPKLINGSSNLAKVLLQNSGLKLGRVDSVKSTFGPGLVIRQKFKGSDIAPNTQLDKGAIIDIVVSKKMSLADTNLIQPDPIESIDGL